jgi:hypothetical protein
MEYTLPILAAFGVLGILIHNLIKLNEINRAADGNINLWKYYKLERFSIALSCCVITVALIARTEISQLESVGKWLGLAFTTAGYMAQSIVITFMGRAKKFMEVQDQKDTPDKEYKPDQP